MKNLIIVILFFFSCNESRIPGMFEEKVKLESLLRNLEESSWRLLTKKSPILSDIDWYEFQDYVLNSDSNFNNFINPRKELLNFLNYNFDPQLHLNGLIIKERFYSGSKIKYQVIIGIITDDEVKLSKYDLLPEGFSLKGEIKYSDEEYFKWITKLKFANSDTKDKKSIVYCLNIFAPDVQFSELIKNSYYFP